jgi:hypothetical protein
MIKLKHVAQLFFDPSARLVVLGFSIAGNRSGVGLKQAS